MYVLALLKVIESYNEKSGIYFFCNEGFTYSARRYTWTQNNHDDIKKLH